MGLRGTETYCRDAVDPLEQTGGPDFVTESWIDIVYFELNPDFVHIL